VKILVAGQNGFAGNALFDHFQLKGHEMIEAPRSTLDLTNRIDVFNFFNRTKPDVVINAAAKVGGILANSRNPVNFISQNLMIQTNLVDAAFENGVSRFVFLGSSCIYPKETPQPIKENYLMTGLLEPTNSAYAVAKIAGIEQIKSYRKQHQKSWISVMPTNLYGPRDNFDLASSHVMAALVRKFLEAKKSKSSIVEIWGDGTPKRDFIYIDDFVSAIEILLERYDADSPINIGSGSDISISELASKIAGIVGYVGELSFDRSKPNGTLRKILDITKISSLNWKPSVSLDEGILRTARWYETSNGVR
jgi:GDP-L-fucose synthase